MGQERWGVELESGPGSRVGYEQCRVIATARSLEAINAAVDEGFFPLLRDVVPSQAVHFMIAVGQDPATGKVRRIGDMRDDLRDLVLEFRNYYPYHFPSPFAAYLLPPDLQAGEEVWLDDLIEDVVAIRGNQGYCPRLACAPARWNGRDFELAFRSKRDAAVWIG